MQKLPSEIVSLVHHVKLNESGWWEKAVQNLIISIFGTNTNTPLKTDEVFEKLKSELGNGFDKTRFLKYFELLKEQGTLVPFPLLPDTFILSDEKFDEFKQAFEIQKAIEAEAEKRFVELAKKYCPEIDYEKLWNDFNEYLVLPLIKEIGAKTYELISGELSLKLEETTHYQTFLNKYPDVENVNLIIINFFEFKNKTVKSFILRQLNAYFFVEATNLSPSTVEKIYSLSKTQANLNVFVDTNFLLTLLDLHDNPSNEATIFLLDLLEEIKNKVRVKFYVLPITIDEFQNLISNSKDHLKRINPTLSYASIVEQSNEFSGILKRYFQKCHQKGKIINIDDYFDSYLSNFLVNVRGKGLEIYQGNFEKYATEQKVVDDLLSQVDYRFEKFKNCDKAKSLKPEELTHEKQKIYDKFNHDCKLWHIIRDKRPTYIDSVKDITNWIITLDFSFLEFDRYKQKIDKSVKISVCLHPNELISMLQFWIPRTEKFENAILGNFRLPFLFKEVDAESERISVEILKALSMYEDSKEFSNELIAEILTNKALRQKIKPSNTIEQNADLIKEEVFRRYEESSRLLEQEKSEKLELKVTLHAVKKELGLLNKRFDQMAEEQLKTYRNFKVKELETKKSELKIRIDLYKERLIDIEANKKNADSEVQRKLTSIKYRFKAFFSSEEVVRRKLEDEISPMYYDGQKYSELREVVSRLQQEYDNFIIPAIDQKIIIYCENQNAKFLNALKFQDIHFYHERDSNGVFIKTVANPTNFGLRDRDYLSDSEIEKLKKRYPNYIILLYYCFENYLYHPTNLIEVITRDFDVDNYTQEIIHQRDANYDKILTLLKTSRNNYQEFKISEEKIKDRDEGHIIENLKSSDIEVLLKSFDMKTYFNKRKLEQYNLTADRLSSTEWFRKQIGELLSNIRY